MGLEDAPLRAAGMRGFQSLHGIGNGRADHWLKSIGIDTSKDRWEESLISFRSMIEMLEGISALKDIPELGLMLAEKQDIGVLGALGVAIQNGRTLRDSFRICEKYISFHSPACQVHFEAHADGEGFFSFDIDMKQMSRSNQAYELSVGLLHRWAKGIAGTSGNTSSEVWFKHLPTSDMSAYRRVFGITPKFGMPRNGIVFAAANLDKPNLVRSDVLSELSLHYLASKELSQNSSFAEEVRRSVTQFLRFESCTQGKVAAAMRMTVRTLQRRLQAENTSFDAILDEVRRSLAEGYLRQPKFPLAKVAEYLQFNDSSAFTRACHRWFGSSPKQVRDDLLAHDGTRIQEVKTSLLRTLPAE